MSFTRYVPLGSGIGAVYAHDRRVWDPFLEFTHELMRGPSPLTVAERELIAAYVSRLAACNYCAGAHGAAAAILGFPAEVLDALVSDIETAPVPEKLRTLLRFVNALTLTPTELSRSHIEVLTEAGWDDLAINHAVGVASRYVMATRISHAHGILVDDARLREAGATMADPEWTCSPSERRRVDDG